jgi:hypothetical protein
VSAELAAAVSEEAAKTTGASIATDAKIMQIAITAAVIRLK